MSGNSLINLDGLSEPATALINRVSDAIGGICKPWQIKRVAAAEAEAEKTKAVARIEISELEQRALQRLVSEESRKQEIIESITGQSLPQLSEKAKPEDIEEDWLTNFFDKCRLTSDEEMQSIWSNILAGEANHPGSFSRRTVNFMGTLDKQDALLFTKLCGFNWIIGGIQPLIYDSKTEIYTRHGINFETLEHLDAIGLISFNNVTGYVRQGFPQRIAVQYQNAPIIIEFQKENANDLQIGKARLTNIGVELATICGPEAVAGFEEYVLEQWIKKGLKLSCPINSPAKTSANKV
jgi:Protein of unknown function (DUF2806)